MDKREQILQGISKWIDSKVDDLTRGNIWMALASNTIKRVANEFIETIVPIDVLVLMLSNRGVIDADIFADELVSAINNAQDVKQEYGGVLLRINNGVISVELPSNSIVKGLLNGNNVLNFREADIRELAQYINNKEE